MDKKTIASLEEVVNYLHHDEERHWDEDGKPSEHIYHAVHRLAQWLDNEKNGEHAHDCNKGHLLCRHCGQCSECDTLIDEQDGGHIHAWGTIKETPSGEEIQWCTDCEATRDSAGGIIE